MRAITKDAVNAFKNWKNFKRSNTEIEQNWGFTFFYLHGNCIASYNKIENKLKIASCGWETTTTKERLNWILHAFNLGGIFQKNWTWFYENNWDVQKFDRVLEFSL